MMDIVIGIVIAVVQSLTAMKCVSDYRKLGS